MANSPWKETERRTARLLGGQRVGCTGKATPDVVAGWLVAECKHRKTLPQWIAHALAQARTAARSMAATTAGWGGVVAFQSR